MDQANQPMQKMVSKLYRTFGRNIPNANLEWHHLYEGSKGVGCRRTDIIIWITHPTKDGYDHEDDIRKSFYIQTLNDICNKVYDEQVTKLKEKVY